MRYKLSDRVILKDDVQFEFKPDLKEFSKYRITRKTEFGNLIKILTSALSFGSTDKVVKIINMNFEKLEVSATTYGWTLLKLHFPNKYFTIEKYE